MSVINVNKAKRKRPPTDMDLRCLCGHTAHTHRPIDDPTQSPCDVASCGCVHYVRGYRCAYCKRAYVSPAERDRDQTECASVTVVLRVSPGRACASRTRTTLLTDATVHYHCTACTWTRTHRLPAGSTTTRPTPTLRARCPRCACETVKVALLVPPRTEGGWIYLTCMCCTYEARVARAVFPHQRLGYCCPGCGGAFAT